MSTRLENLQQYENGLRNLVTNCLHISVPTIPQNISPITEILFLEKLLHVNGFRLEEREYYIKNEKLTENILEISKYECKYMFVKDNIMRCAKGKFTGSKCKNKHDSFHCIDTIPFDKI